MDAPGVDLGLAHLTRTPDPADSAWAGRCLRRRRLSARSNIMRWAGLDGGSRFSSWLGERERSESGRGFLRSVERLGLVAQGAWAGFCFRTVTVAGVPVGVGVMVAVGGDHRWRG